MKGKYPWNAFLLITNCRDSSDIVVSEQHFTEARVSLDLDTWKEISPEKDTDSVRSPEMYSNFYPHLFKTRDGELVLRCSGIWAELRGWYLLILVILFWKTLFRNRKYPEDSREEFLEICLKSKLFWTFCILWILNLITLGAICKITSSNKGRLGTLREPHRPQFLRFN